MRNNETEKDINRIKQTSKQKHLLIQFSSWSNRGIKHIEPRRINNCKRESGKV